MLLFENVDSMEDAKPGGGGASIMDVLKSEMHNRGYMKVNLFGRTLLSLACHAIVGGCLLCLFVCTVGCPLFTWTNRPSDAVFQTLRGLYWLGVATPAHVSVKCCCHAATPPSALSSTSGKHSRLKPCSAKGCKSPRC